MKVIKFLIVTAAAASIGIGMLAVASDASARTTRHHYWFGAYGYIPSERPPPGQIYQRGFGHAINREQVRRQDFQLDGWR
jgi:hypothetical protein